jgi:DtxR family Mn-dependent transcriptional regulator
MLTFSEENYLKSIFHIANQKDEEPHAGTNELATHLGLKPASINNMLKKLKEKKLIDYEKYGKIALTESGVQMATAIVRKHRLWETFLYEKLGFPWDEVHEIAEQLEHIQSDKLIERLDRFLSSPKFDPHGDPIPNAAGAFEKTSQKTLAEIPVSGTCIMVGVKDNSAVFLKHADSLQLYLNQTIRVHAHQEYDALTIIEVAGKRYAVGQKFLGQIFVEEIFVEETS